MKFLYTVAVAFLFAVNVSAKDVNIMIPIEAHLEYKIAKNNYSPPLKEIKITDFNPATATISEFESYISYLNDSFYSSADCAKANDLYRGLFENDPNNALIYSFIPSCRFDGIRTKEDISELEKWFLKGAELFGTLSAEKASDPNTIWTAEKFFIDYFAFRLVKEWSGLSLRHKEEETQRWHFYNDAISRIMRMRELAEKLHKLSPKDNYARGLLGSLYVGEYFFSAFQPENILSKMDYEGINKAIKLLKGVDIPAAYSDLAKAYMITKDLQKAYEAQIAGIKKYPGFRDGVENLLAIYAMEKPVLSPDAAMNRAGKILNILIERLEKNKNVIPRDYLLIARLFEITGSLQDGVNYIEKGLVIFPNDAELNIVARNLKIK